MMIDGGINQKVQEYQMIMKSVFAAAAIAGAVALGSAGSAQADPHVSVGIGFGDGGWDGGPGFYDGGYGDGYGDGYGWRRHHRRWEDPAPYRISCAQGRNIVASSGFRGVYANDCSAPVYRYTAWKRGEQFRVAVSVRGRIVAVNPIY
jgi:hypothetical protein